MPKVIIDTADNLLYKSFYIYALEKKFGCSNVSYSREPFLGLDNQGTRGVAFVIKNGLKETRYYIHANDSYKVLKPQYDWCDVYGHVNANYALTDASYRDKIVSLCPSFGIRCWGVGKAVLRCLADARSSGNSLRTEMGQHYHMLLRAPYSEYAKEESINNNYIFFLSTLWYNNEWNNNDSTVNKIRAAFIRACKNNCSICFDGGFVAQTGGRSSVSLFEDCMYEGGEIAVEEWIKRTKKSMLVFNTPAFWKCQGWKLGEYLAMGKAIVSTPLFNDLPQPLVHGVNVHFVNDDQESMSDAINYIMSHDSYRKSLEIGARDYWARLGSPEATLSLLGI